MEDAGSSMPIKDDRTCPRSSIPSPMLYWFGHLFCYVILEEVPLMSQNKNKRGNVF